jgi:hypothetical protein
MALASVNSVALQFVASLLGTCESGKPGLRVRWLPGGMLDTEQQGKFGEAQVKHHSCLPDRRKQSRQFQAQCQYRKVTVHGRRKHSRLPHVQGQDGS